MNAIGKEELKGLLEMGSVPVCRTLYNLLGKRAKMTVTDIKKVGMDDIANHLPRFSAVFEGSNAQNGHRADVMLVFKKEDVARLANYIMGSDLNRDNSMDEVAVAVLQKVALQCIRASLSEMGDFIECESEDLQSHVEIYESVEPVIEKIETWGDDPEVCIISCQLALEGIFKADILMVASRRVFELLDSSAMAELAVMGEDGVDTRRGRAAAPVKKEKVIAVQEVYFPEFKYEPLEDTIDFISDDRKCILDVSVDVAVRVGGTVCSVKDILAMKEGQVLTLDKQAGSPADIVVNGALIGHGDIIVTDDHFAARINEIVDKKE
ncbi:MAG: FliM/FliN family flagellar motor switch protein [Hungatella hathewayi]